MASKVCGVRTGVAKQATIISVVMGGSAESIISNLNLILFDIISRQRRDQALPGRTVLSMSFKYEPSNPSSINPREIDMMAALLRSIMNLGVICVCAAGNDAKFRGFPRTGYPAALATPRFPLIPVGAVGVTANGGIERADFSQEGVVYMVGVNSPCAAYDSHQLEMEADGTSGGEPLDMELKSPDPVR